MEAIGLYKQSYTQITHGTTAFIKDKKVTHSYRNTIVA